MGKLKHLNSVFNRVFVFPGPRPWPPVWICRPWPPIRIYWPWPPICIYRPWPPICVYRPWPKPCIYQPWYLNDIYQPRPRPRLWPQFVFTTSGQDFTTTTTITSTTTATIATTTTTSNKKRYLRGSKIRIKWPLKSIWWKSQVLFQ